MGQIDCLNATATQVPPSDIRSMERFAVNLSPGTPTLGLLALKKAFTFDKMYMSYLA